MSLNVMTFDEVEKAMAKRKTLVVGNYRGCHIDVYTKRDGSGRRVIRVSWYEPNPNNPNRISRLAWWVEKQRLFGYSADELCRAVVFIECVNPASKWNEEHPDK